MRTLIVGLGIQGKKRMAVAGSDVVTTVDPVAPEAVYKRLEDVPLADFDAALVCTPDQTKVELVRYLLDHGKHVLVEKPLLAPDDETVWELAALARARRLACYTAYNHRFEPWIVRMKEVLETQVLGPIYLARLFYGNGTARDVRQSPWRDQGLGVLPDIGSHLLDMMLFWFGRPEALFETWGCHRFENRTLDHILFGSQGPPVLELEATLVSWRNTFTADIYGEQGSAHIHGLCKWGPTHFIVRRRVLPSGSPSQEIETLHCPDPTWAREYEHFAQLCRTGGTNLDNDVWINGVLNALSRGVGVEQLS